MFFFRSLAAEWGKYGMRFNAIAPGPIETKVMTVNSVNLIANTNVSIDIIIIPIVAFALQGHS